MDEPVEAAVETWGSARKDVLERACANCLTRYPIEDPACPSCFAPAVRAYSRWRGGPLSFGLPTKLVVAGVLATISIGHGVWILSAFGGIGWPRALSFGVPLLLPIPFLFRRTRIR